MSIKKPTKLNITKMTTFIKAKLEKSDNQVSHRVVVSALHSGW